MTRLTSSSLSGTTWSGTTTVGAGDAHYFLQYRICSDGLLRRIRDSVRAGPMASSLDLSALAVSGSLSDAGFPNSSSSEDELGGLLKFSTSLHGRQASMGGTTTLILNRALLHGRMGFAVNHNRSLHTPTTPHTTKRRIHTSHPHEAQRHADVLMVCVRFETTETEAELRAASPSARSLWRTPGISIRTTEISRSRVH